MSAQGDGTPIIGRIEQCPACGRMGNIGGHKFCRGDVANRHSPERWEWVEVVPVAAVERLRDICGVVCAAGRHGEPLACAHPRGHDGQHSWASLPTFANGVAVEDVERVAQFLEKVRVSPAEAQGHIRNAAGMVRHLLLGAARDAR